MTGVVRITLQPLGLTLHSEGALRLLDLLDERDEQILPFSCRSANCGVCRVRVVRGAALLSPKTKGEEDTLRGLHASADERLACQLRLTPGSSGEVELQVRSRGAPGAAP